MTLVSYLFLLKLGYESSGPSPRSKQWPGENKIEYRRHEGGGGGKNTSAD